MKKSLSSVQPDNSVHVLQSDGNGNDNDSDSDSDSDSEFKLYDSDFDAEDGDDDLFAENVDKSVNDNNEKEVCEEHEDVDALEDTDLNLAKADRERLKNQFKVFNPEVDMDNPSFSLGMVFSGVEEVRKSWVDLKK